MKNSSLKIYKKPLYENDSFHFSLGNYKFDNIKVAQLLKTDDYLYAKNRSFSLININPEPFREKHLRRPSLRNIDKVKRLTSTIYPFSLYMKNDIKYHVWIEKVKENLNKNDRRNVTRFLNPYREYSDSMDHEHMDVSCLTSIHHLKYRVIINNRAIDLKYEALYDFILNHIYFIEPIYENEYRELEFFSSTCQNIKSLNNFLTAMKEIFI
jgi:hypothetical protein